MNEGEINMNDGLAQPTIMVVDDTKANLKLLDDMLRARGYRVRAFPSGELALTAAAKHPPDLILLDITMPVMNGFEVCKRLKADGQLKEIPVIFISALNDTTDKVRAFEAGGVDYVTKPFQFAEVQARVETHLGMRKLQIELERHNKYLNELVQEKVQEISDSQMATIFALATLAESRDDITGRHIKRTQTFCRLLATALIDNPRYAGTVDLAYADDIYSAAPLHDIGKVAIPDSILLKPGKLTSEEFVIMKKHAETGAMTLKVVQERYPKNAFLAMGIAIAQSHHEKWDGSGYPDGLRGEDIPLCARIMAVADVYDALRSKRTYKEAFSHEKACEIIREGAGQHFDPDLIAEFLALETEFARVLEHMDEGDHEVLEESRLKCDSVS
jgi:putative two-component system response regulator